MTTQTKSNHAKKLVNNMQSYATRLEQEGELDRAELISSWAKVFQRIGTLNNKFFGIAGLSFLIASCVFGGASINGNVVNGSYTQIASGLGIGLFSIGLIFTIIYMRNHKSKQ